MFVNFGKFSVTQRLSDAHEKPRMMASSHIAGFPAEVCVKPGIKLTPIQFWKIQKMPGANKTSSEGYTHDIFYGALSPAQMQNLWRVILPNPETLFTAKEVMSKTQTLSIFLKVILDKVLPSSLQMDGVWFQNGKLSVCANDLSDGSSPIAVLAQKANSDGASRSRVPVDLIKDCIEFTKPLVEKRRAELSTFKKNFKGPGQKFTVDVSLADIEPRIWRRLSFPGHISLHELHACLIAPAFGHGSNYHAYAFRPSSWVDKHEDGPFIGPTKSTALDMMFVPVLYHGEFVQDSQKVRVDEVLKHTCDSGETLQYIYDLGDCWKYDILPLLLFLLLLLLSVCLPQLTLTATKGTTSLTLPLKKRWAALTAQAWLCSLVSELAHRRIPGGQ
jgi:hypothetical protein